MLLVNDCINFIGIFNNNDNLYPQHVIWNFNKKDMKIIHTFNKYEDITGFSLIHLKKQNQLMLCDDNICRQN